MLHNLFFSREFHKVPSELVSVTPLRVPNYDANCHWRVWQCRAAPTWECRTFYYWRPNEACCGKVIVSFRQTVANVSVLLFNSSAHSSLIVPNQCLSSEWSVWHRQGIQNTQLLRGVLKGHTIDQGSAVHKWGQGTRVLWIEQIETYSKLWDQWSQWANQSCQESAQTPFCFTA